MNIKTLASSLLLLTLLAGCGKPTPPSASKSAPPVISIQDAARTGNLEAIQQHIKATSNLNEKAPDSGGSPLHTAAVFGHLEAVQALVQAGADVNARNNDGATPLLVAAFFCRTEIVQHLLAHGADKQAKDKAGKTALDSVSVPFDQVKGLYDFLQAVLAPAGLKLDYEQLKATRPKIANLLR
jgi:predicted small lipoprotein YifL